MASAGANEHEQDFRSTFRMRRVLIPVVIGMLAAGWLLWRDLAKERFEHVGAGLGDHQWVDANGNRIADLADATDFTSVGVGLGDYKRMTARETLRSINWTWHMLFIIINYLHCSAAKYIRRSY